MKIESMREYITLCEYLNFTSAAKKLYTTQPSLSYRIAGIEKEIGVQLVDHSHSSRQGFSWGSPEARQGLRYRIGEVQTRLEEAG